MCVHTYTQIHTHIHISCACKHTLKDIYKIIFGKVNHISPSNNSI